MDKRKAYEEKLAAQLDKWRALIALFKAESNIATAEAKIEYCEIAQTLQHKQDEARVKLMELQAASNEAWEDLKTGGQKAWTEIGAAFHSAASRLGK